MSQLAVHAGWYAANIRTLLCADAEYDRRQCIVYEQQLARTLSVPAAKTFGQVALSAAWHAANTRRFMLFDAARDWRALDANCGLLSGLVGEELALAMRELALHAARYAANVRSLYCCGAAREWHEFGLASARLASLLRQQHVTRAKRSTALQLLAETAPRQPGRAGVGTCADICARASVCASLPGRLCVCLGGLSRRADVELASGMHQSRVCLLPTEHRESGSTRAVSSSASSPVPDLARSGSHRLELCLWDDGSLEGAARLWQYVADRSKVRADGSGDTPIEPFLVAGSAVVSVLEAFGSGAAPFCKDVRANIDKVRRRSENRSCASLEELVSSDVCEGRCSPSAGSAREGSASLALIWLGRSLRMIVNMLGRSLSHPQLAFRECIIFGYDASLRRHHNKLTQQLILAGILGGAPSRAQFLAKLGTDAEQVESAMRGLLQVCVPVLARLHNFFIGLHLDSEDVFPSARDTSAG